MLKMSNWQGEGYFLKMKNDVRFNIIQVATSNASLIRNGDFEEMKHD